MTHNELEYWPTAKYVITKLGLHSASKEFVHRRLQLVRIGHVRESPLRWGARLARLRFPGWNGRNCGEGILNFPKVWKFAVKYFEHNKLAIKLAYNTDYTDRVNR